MLGQQLEIFQKLHAYLSSKTSAIVEAFHKTLTINDVGIQHFVLAFPYENLELAGVFKDSMKLYPIFDGIISKDLIDDLASFEYNEEIPTEDFIYWETYNLTTELFKLWLVSCFEKSEIAEKIAFKIYFVHNHDDMEILELNKMERWINQEEAIVQHNLNLNRTIKIYP